MAGRDDENSQAQGLITELEREFRPGTSTHGRKRWRSLPGGIFVFAHRVHFRTAASGMAITSRRPRSTILDVPTARAGTRSTAFRHTPRGAAGWAIFAANGRRRPACRRCPWRRVKPFSRSTTLRKLPPDAGQPAVNQFQVLDAYVGLAFSNWQVTFGRQSLWWGPGDGGPLIFSDNAGPLNMFRINRVTPFKLPSVLGWLGPMRLEFFLGQLGGQQFINGPARRRRQLSAYAPPAAHDSRRAIYLQADAEFRIWFFADRDLRRTRRAIHSAHV